MFAITFHRYRVLALAAAAFLLACASWFHRASAAPQSAPPPALVPADAVRLSDDQWSTLEVRAVTHAAFATITTADAVVSTDDDATVPVFSPTSGRIAAVHVAVGQTVHKGQALATIAGSETSQAAADLAAAIAQARTATSQLALARATLARQQGLVEAGGGARKDLLQAQSDLAAAEGAKSTADAALEASRAKASAVGIEGGAAPGPLTSPIDGEVIQRQAVAGQFIGSLASGSATPLFTVSDLRRVWVVGSVGEGDAARVRVGQGVAITVAGGVQPLRATIGWVAPTVDAQTRRVAFRAVVPNPDHALRPLMSAHVRVLDAHAPSALAIPASAVIFDGAAAHCFVVSGQRQLSLRKLTVGRSDGGLVEVLSGLDGSERVVARGAIFVDALAEGAAS